MPFVLTHVKVNKTPARYVRQLALLKRVFDSTSAGKKIEILSSFRATKANAASVLKEYHSCLLFIIAYPDNQAVLETAVEALDRLNTALLGMKRWDDPELLNSGLPGTQMNWRPGLHAMQWLERHAANDIFIDWEDEESVEKVEAYLPFLVEPVELEGTGVAHLSTREWLELSTGAAKGRNEQRLVEFITSHFAELNVKRELVDKWFEDLLISIDWNIREVKLSKSLRIPVHHHFTHSEGLLRSANTLEWVQQPVQIEPVDTQAGRELCDLLKPVLYARKRETDPATFANPSEVYRVKLDRGMEIVLNGMQPNRRLYPDSYIGYTLLKNGLPVAYGGGWSFLDRCEIGINIFEEYRGGESTIIFLNILRAYYHLFSVSRFIVLPYQFGQDNEEGLLSGAYWFYHRLGFRSTDRHTMELADREYTRMQAKPEHKSSIAVLKKFAEFPVELKIHSSPPAFRKISHGKLALYVSEWIGSRFAGHRENAKAWAVERMRKMLNATQYDSFSPDEKHAFAQLALWFAPFDEISSWTTAQKAELIDAMRCKGSEKEAPFSAKLRRHDAAIALLTLACSGKGLK